MAENPNLLERNLEDQIGRKVDQFQLLLAEEKLRPQKPSPCFTRHSDKLKVVTGVTYLSKKYKDLLGYLILIHFFDFDEKHRCYCVLDLEEQLKENGQFYFLSALVESKTFLIKFLLEQECITTNVLFGSILSYQNLKSLADSIILRFEEQFRRPKRTIRRRGYKDKGSLPNESTTARRQEEQKDFTLKELQLLIEEKQDIRNYKTTLFREWLDGCRTLTEEELVEFRILKQNIKERLVK